MEKSAKQQNNDNTLSLPVLTVRGLVFFPGMMLQFDVSKERSINAINYAVSQKRLLFITSQIDITDEEPAEDDLYTTGAIVKIKQVIQRSDEGIKLYVEGVCRGELLSITSDNESFIKADILKVFDSTYRKTTKTDALIRIVHERFDEYVRLYRKISPDILLGVLKENHCGKLADYITSNIAISIEKKQEILDEYHPVTRLKKLIDILTEENKILSIENDINQKTQERIDENQREYYLKEQMRAIASELGDDENSQQEIEDMKEKILSLNLKEDIELKLLKEVTKLSRMPFGSHEASVIRVYLELCLSMPWNTYTKDKIDINKAQKVLDRDHYGLDKVKERFLEILAVGKLTNKNNTNQIICLAGPPGVGKTSIAHSIAEATGRKYVRISLGGVSDEAEIMGHRKTYVGSMPGRIINAIKQVGVNNPLILLDEIDKLGQNFKGDPASALLEVLDPEQNGEFTDHYLDVPFSLKNVMFITTANNINRIPGPLYDRMDIIELGSYTLEEKMNIATKYLVKKQRERNGIKADQLKFDRNAIKDLIEGYTKEAGVRSLERNIASICRKVARKIVTEKDFKTFRVRSDNLELLIGPRKFSKDLVTKTNAIGLVNGLAWTSVGGEILPIEVAVMPGTGKIQLTGSLGNVMKESASAALTCIRTRSEKLGLNPDFYDKNDIHIHAPEGAVPKDGPSAGISMATAITSAFCSIPIKGDVAMTGEITLQGRVLPIGGLKEKAMAAYKSGMKTVIIPHDNISDLSEVDDVVKENVKFIPVKDIDSVLDTALEFSPKKPKVNKRVVHKKNKVQRDIINSDATAVFSEESVI